MIASKKDYNRKMDALTSDTASFIELSEDPTARLARKNNRLIAALHNKTHQFITVEQRKYLTTYTAVAPKIYGQFKCHKEGYPLRNIISTINSPSYKISKCLAKILRNFFKP